MKVSVSKARNEIASLCADLKVSWHRGAEGETDYAGINALRSRHKRNRLATLFLTRGVPMLLVDDEISNTQGGKNNTYCQDSKIGWLNWDRPVLGAGVRIEMT